MSPTANDSDPRRTAVTATTSSGSDVAVAVKIPPINDWSIPTCADNVGATWDSTQPHTETNAARAMKLSQVCTTLSGGVSSAAFSGGVSDVNRGCHIGARSAPRVNRRPSTYPATISTDTGWMPWLPSPGNTMANSGSASRPISTTPCSRFGSDAAACSRLARR